MSDIEQQARSGRIARLIAQHEPFGGWTNADDRDRWALVTVSGPLRWLRTFPTRDAVDEYARHGLTGDEALMLLVDLTTGDELVPVVDWVVPMCTWPTCSNAPAANGRRFRDGRLCHEHTAESHEIDAAARDEVPTW